MNEIRYSQLNPAKGDIEECQYAMAPELYFTKMTSCIGIIFKFEKIWDGILGFHFPAVDGQKENSIFTQNLKSIDTEVNKQLESYGGQVETIIMIGNPEECPWNSWMPEMVKKLSFLHNDKGQIIKKTENDTRWGVITREEGIFCSTKEIQHIPGNYKKIYDSLKKQPC